MSQDQISDANYALALAAGREAVATEIRASAVRYSAEHDALEIITLCHAGFLIPRLWIEALQDVPLADLARLRVWEDGSAIELSEHDIQISVDGLLSAVLPKILLARWIAAIFAAQGDRTVWKKLVRRTAVSACPKCSNAGFDLETGKEINDPNARVKCGKCGCVCAGGELVRPVHPEH